MQIGHTFSNASFNASASGAVMRSRIEAGRQISDETLLDSIARGDKDALKELYVRHYSRVHRFLVRLMGNEAVAEEIVNEAFLAVWRHARRFQAKSRAATWLLAIARHKALTELRRRSEAPLEATDAMAIEDPADGPAAAMDKRDRSALLRKCLAKLSPRHREVINLVYYRDKTVEEAARLVGAPVSTVKTRMFYARCHMARLLAKAGVDRAWAAV